MQRSVDVGAVRVPQELARGAVQRCQEYEDEAWELLESLVGVDSSPEDVPGLETVVEMMRPRWEELGFTTVVERTAAGLPVLVSERIVSPEVPTLLVLGHLDTVFPAGTVADRPFRREGDRVLGPGVADMKGGVVASWMAIRAAIELTGGLNGLNVRIINNTDEEAGSAQSRALIERSAQGVDLALVFEPARPDGSVVTGRRGLRRYRIAVTGRPAHTGVEPWAGANANVELAHKIIALDALNDRDRFLSVTCSLMRGGERINIVPESASVDIDVRVPDLPIAEEAHEAISRIAAKTFVEGTATTVEVIGDRPPMVPDAVVEGVVAAMTDTAAVQSVEFRAITTGGGSDGSFVSALGVPTVDGLGPVGGGYHTAEEFMWGTTLVERAAVVGGYLAGLGSA